MVHPLGHVDVEAWVGVGEDDLGQDGGQLQRGLALDDDVLPPTRTRGQNGSKWVGLHWLERWGEGKLLVSAGASFRNDLHWATMYFQLKGEREHKWSACLGLHWVGDCGVRGRASYLLGRDPASERSVGDPGR
jgi:hypothetical protein